MASWPGIYISPRSTFYAVSFVTDALRIRWAAMAFRKRWSAPGRRRYAGMRGRSRRSSRNFRSTRRGFGRVNLRQKRLPRRQARKRFIRNVASKKKWDTMRSVQAVQDADRDPLIVLDDGPTQVFLFCPNYRNLDRDVSNDHTRNAQDVYYRGFSETFWVQTGSTPLVHRRIVFWAQQIIEQARALITFEPNAPPTYYRPFTDIRGDSLLMEYLFQGTTPADWQGQFPLSAKLDRRHCRVISDTRKITNPGNETGTQKLYKTWVGVNRRLSYADDENGAGETSSPWTGPIPFNPGNLYVMDIFTQGFTGPTVGDVPARFTTQATSYWHEA